MEFKPILKRCNSTAITRYAMLLNLETKDQLADLEKRLHGAEAMTAELIADAMASGCVRLAALPEACRAKLKWLIEAGAWNDAVMALIELELPQWKLRRLVRDEDEWFCSLSRQPALPIEYDQTADAAHASLSMAICRKHMSCPG
jgi:hypothetical protein